MGRRFCSIATAHTTSIACEGASWLQHHVKGVTQREGSTREPLRSVDGYHLPFTASVRASTDREALADIIIAILACTRMAAPSRRLRESCHGHRPKTLHAGRRVNLWNDRPSSLKETP